MTEAAPATVDTSAKALQTMIGAAVDKASRKAAKAAARSAEKRLNSVDPRDRPGGTGATLHVNFNRPQRVSISRAIRAMKSGSWKSAPLEWDWNQAAREALPFNAKNDDEADRNAFLIPASREASATVAEYAGIKMADSPVGKIAAAYRDMSEAQTVSITGDTLGGTLVPPQFLQDEFVLSAQSAVTVRNAPGVDTIPVTSSIIYLPRETALAAGAAVAEAGIITATDSDFARQQFVIEKLAVLSQYSNELLADSNPALDAYLSRSLARRISLLEDLEFLTGNGTPPNLQGIIGYPGVTALSIGSLAALNAAVADKFMDAVYNVRAQNIEPNAWIMSPKALSFVSKIKDSQNRYLFEAMGGNFGAPVVIPTAGALASQTTYTTGAWRGMLLGYPVLLSTQIGDNNLILGDFNFVRILRRQAFELAVSPHILFTTDQTAVRVTSRVALAITIPQAVGVATDLAYV
jgi:HK97 family phage major capsid protein